VELGGGSTPNVPSRVRREYFRTSCIQTVRSCVYQVVNTTDALTGRTARLETDGLSPREEYTKALAFSDFFLAERERAFQLAYVILHDRELAEDVTQEAFVQILTRWGSIDEPRPYLTRTVVNGARSAIRRKSSTRFASRRLLHLFEEEARTRPPIEIVDLSSLSPRQQVVITLRYYLQMTDSEISELLSTPLGTVKSDLRRAIKKLGRYNAQD